MEKAKSKKKLVLPITGNQLIILVALVGVFVVFTTLNKNFLSWMNVTNILIAATLTGFVAIGHTYLIMLGENDLGPGSYAAFSGVFVGVLLQKGVPAPLAIGVILAIAVLTGLFNSCMVTKIGLSSFIATFISQSIFRGLAYIVCNGNTIAISDPLLSGIGKLRMGGNTGIPYNVIALLFAFIVAGIILSKTDFGRSIYAVGGNPEAARLAGLKANKIKTICFVLISVFSSIGGVILAGRMNAGVPASCLGLEFDSITAVIIGGVSFSGGVGNMLGSFLGVLLIQSFNTGLTMAQVQTFWQYVARGILLLIALGIDRYTTKNRQREMLAESMRNM